MRVRLQASDAELGIEALMEKMKKLTEAQEEMTQEELLKRFKRVETQSAEREYCWIIGQQTIAERWID